MSFSRRFNSFLKDNNNIYIFSFNNGINLKRYTLDNTKLSENRLFYGNYSLSNSYFDVYDNNCLYGLVYDNNGNLIYLFIDNLHVYKTIILSINPKASNISFPYIKKIDNVIHIFFYFFKTNSSNKCTLIHYFYNGHCWNKHILDTIDFYILTNYSVLWNNSSPTILYLNTIDNYDEIVLSKFNCFENAWCTPFQVSDSKKSKIYLSALQDNNQNYHIVYSENNSNKYYCNYTSGFIDNNIFNISLHSTIKDTVACEFPTISLINNSLYCQWIEYNNLFTSISNNLGSSWESPLFFQDKLNNDFSQYKCKTLNSNKIDVFYSYESKFEMFDLNLKGGCNE